MTQRIAIIDLGSNSARLIVMHIYTNGAYNLVYHQKESVRLSEGMSDSNMLQPAAIARAITTLQLFAEMCRLFNVDLIIAVATAAVRNAHNRQQFLDLVQERAGIVFNVISGEEEAKLGFTGVINTIDVTSAVLFDLGGGSTEITLIKDRKPEKVISVPIGAVSLTERFRTQDRVSEAKLNDLNDYIMSYLEVIPWLTKNSLPLIGVGGTARNLAKMDQRRKNYPFSKVHNYRFGHISFNELWKSLVSTSYNQRRKFPGLSSERADIIIAGATMAKCLFDTVGAPYLIVSGCGVREGLFLKHYLDRAGLEPVIPDILEHSTRNMLLFYKGNAGHAYHVAELADTMFEGWQELHKLTPRDRKLLRVASLLHDIGITINYYDHPRHSAYLVENARLFGLSHREQMLTALIAGWHNGPSSKYLRYKLYNEFLDEMDWHKGRKLACLLALAESLDATQTGAIRKIDAFLKGETPHMTLFTDGQDAIERQDLERHRKWFRKEFGAELTVN